MSTLPTKPLASLNEQSETGSAPTSPKAVVGVVLGSHGVHGEIRVRSLTDIPYRFDPGELLYLETQPVRIQNSSPVSGNTLLLKLEGVDNPATAHGLVGQELLAREEDSPDLPEGEYFHYQLIGMRVFTEDGEDLGSIEEIIITGSNDVYVVSGAGGEVLLPALSQVILDVDKTGGIMTVRLMDGLR